MKATTRRIRHAPSVDSFTPSLAVDAAPTELTSSKRRSTTPALTRRATARQPRRPHTSPSRTAYSAACVRSDRPSLARMLPTWRLDGLLGDAEVERDRLVRAAAGDQREHLALARGQRRGRRAAAAVRVSSRRTRAATAGCSSASPPSTVRIALTRSAGCDVLEQVARRARADRGQHLVLVEEARQHDDARRRAARAQRLDRADAAEPRHDEVHEHDVGLERRPRRPAPARRRPPRRRPRCRPAARGTSAAPGARPRGRRR